MCKCSEVILKIMRGEWKMKNKKIFGFNAVLLLIVIALEAIFLAFMPEQVPIHMDIHGNIDGMGSKFIFLLFPLLAFVFWFILYLISRSFEKKNESTNAKAVNITNSALMLLFIVMESIIAILILVNSELNTADLTYKCVCVALGIIYVATGSVLPKTTKNKLIGLRVSWSMYNDNTWARTQKYGGFMLALVGLFTIIASIFIPGIYNMILLVVGLLIILISSLIIAYRVYKTEIAREATSVRK